MEIIVCSDNHGLIAPLEKIVKAYPKADAYIHCGDMELEKQYLEKFYAVTGNNDYFTSYPQELFVKVGDLNIYVTHGHQFYGRTRVSDLSKKALNHHCQVACYGHTHVYDVTWENDVLCINPGSLRYNRDGTPPSYAVLEVENGKFEVTRHLTGIA